jgi:alkylation response protein AidB-like acyl-CoA dehydrogenase
VVARTPPPEALAALPEAAFRRALATFLATEHPGPEPRDPDARLAFQRAWAATLSEHGWAAPSWPRRWGGMELPVEKLVPYHEEMALAEAPSLPSPNAFIVGPSILAFGTDAQRARFLPPIVRGEELWCQGFSEPDAGSDLPSLRTSARLRGDAYVVHGQKVWTSKALAADWIFVLARTGRLEHRHRALTYLLIDLRSPGVSVRPLRDMTGGTYFGEVFFDDAVVPVEQRIGAENDGWRIARHSLGHERSTSRIGMVVKYRRVVAELLELARSEGILRDPLMRQQLAELVIGARLLAMTFERVMANVLRGADPGPASSISRLFLATFEQQLHETAIRVIGAAGMLGAEDPAVPQNGRWTWGFLNTRASTIGAGTSEVQRNTIAEQVLGLPR